VGAANDALRTLAKLTAGQIKIIGGSGPRNIVFTPGVTDLPAEIDTRPGEGRRRRGYWCGLGRESGPGNGDSASRGKKELFAHRTAPMKTEFRLKRAKQKPGLNAWLCFEANEAKQRCLA
jgi:hypothetical protein